jgi:hypothetical protein
MDRRLAPRRRRRVDRIGDAAIGGEPAHDLDQRQHRRRIEEMHAHDARRVGKTGGQRGDRQRRRIRREDRVLGHDHLELAKQRAFRVEVFDDHFDDERGAHAITERVHRQDAVDGRARVIVAELVLGNERVERSSDLASRIVRGAHPRVEKPDGMPRSGRDLRDARAHGARADDRDRRVARECRRHAVCYFPVKRGSRFSRNAATPSR